MLTDEIKSLIKSHALESPTVEVCGFIIDIDGTYYTLKGNNIATNVEHFFQIDPKDYLQASELGKIVGIYHSHPSETPHLPDWDKAEAQKHNLVSILYCIATDSFDVFDPKIGYTNKYTGREFKIGESDCFSLVRDYYWNELKIEITNYSRDENWFEKKPAIFLNYEHENFVKLLEDTALRKHDILLFDYYKLQVPSHCALFLGDSLVLHHPRGCNSRIEKLTDAMLRRLLFAIRHKYL